MDRKSQAPYLIFRYEKSHGDDAIVTIQDWIEKNHNREIRGDLLAHKACMCWRDKV